MFLYHNEESIVSVSLDRDPTFGQLLSNLGTVTMNQVRECVVGILDFGTLSRKYRALELGKRALARPYMGTSNMNRNFPV